jgi:hypothetical protein
MKQPRRSDSFKLVDITAEVSAAIAANQRCSFRVQVEPRTAKQLSRNQRTALPIFCITRTLSQPLSQPRSAAARQPAAQRSRSRSAKPMQSA